jgi:hypothetical protein
MGYSSAVRREHRNRRGPDPTTRAGTRPAKSDRDTACGGGATRTAIAAVPRPGAACRPAQPQVSVGLRRRQRDRIHCRISRARHQPCMEGRASVVRRTIQRSALKVPSVRLVHRPQLDLPGHPRRSRPTSVTIGGKTWSDTAANRGMITSSDDRIGSRPGSAGTCAGVSRSSSTRSL